MIAAYTPPHVGKGTEEYWNSKPIRERAELLTASQGVNGYGSLIGNQRGSVRKTPKSYRL